MDGIWGYDKIKEGGSRAYLGVLLHLYNQVLKLLQN